MITLLSLTYATGGGLVRSWHPLLVVAHVYFQLTSLALHFFPVHGNHAAVLYIAAPVVFCLAAPLIVDLKITEALRLSLEFLAVYTTMALLATGIYRLSPFHPLASYPGPWLWRLSSSRLAYISYLGKRHIVIDELHRKYGPFVRIGRRL